MKLKILATALIAVGMSVTTLAQASAAWNCGYTTDSYPYTATGGGTSYTIKKYADTDWHTCYIQSAIAACKAGQTIKPVSNPSENCNASNLNGLMHKSLPNDTARRSACNRQDARSWLPSGVTVDMCVNEIDAYFAPPVPDSH
ncbi:MAG: hypothetical protein K0U29_00070 [Gammaproteobacteria bacterium]|nr:hypothetical protein [Gammaproteobacteria bacterium]MCH9743302.1 hypothetical protein [Gammaproteobacteria bacterium]